MVKFIPLLILLAFISCRKEKSVACNRKNQICDSALFTLFNYTQDTIFYGIGTNMQEDTLLPGKQRHLKYGRVKITYDKKCEENKESYSTHQLSSNWGTWAYHIDHCDRKAAFKYDDESKTHISLYNITEY